MTSGYGSLLALDSFASEESIRVAAYGRALEFSKMSKYTPDVAEIAACFVGFVGNERWRLDVLDVALSNIDRNFSVDRLIAMANEIADWAKLPEPEPEPESEPEPAKVTRKVEARKK